MSFQLVKGNIHIKAYVRFEAEEAIHSLEGGRMEEIFINATSLRYDYSSGFFISKEKTGSTLWKLGIVFIYLLIHLLSVSNGSFRFGAPTTDLMDRLIHSVGA